jgi:chromosome segregation ATPase
MRNDALDDVEQMPSLSSGVRDRDDLAQHAASSAGQYAPAHALGLSTPTPPFKAPSTGPLWALLGAALIALGGLGWWSFQQISLMEQQLVATQESFARISEDAAGRLQIISGKVVATESSVTGENEALKLRLKQLETQVAQLISQQQIASGLQGGQSKRLQELSAELKLQTEDSAQLDAKYQSLSAEQLSLKAALAELGKLDGQLKTLASELEGLKKQGNAQQAIARLEQDLLVLRSELDSRPAQNSTAEFDAFRGQVSRNINTLQTQVQNLQQQLDKR